MDVDDDDENIFIDGKRKIGKGPLVMGSYGIFSDGPCPSDQCPAHPKGAVAKDAFPLLWGAGCPKNAGEEREAASGKKKLQQMVYNHSFTSEASSTLIQ